MKKKILLLILLFTSKLNFCQSRKDGEADSLWRALMRQGNYQQAIHVIHEMMTENEMANKHRDYWHIAQLYAFDNDCPNALVYFEKSHYMFDGIVDREFNWYYRGTVAFIKKDKKKLESCYTKAWKKKSVYCAVNACRLKGLFGNFEKSYKEGYSAPCQ